MARSRVKTHKTKISLISAKPAVIDSQMTLQTQLGGGCCDLQLTVRLHNAARDERVSLTSHSFVQHVVELAKLVAAKSDSCCIFSLHPRSEEHTSELQSLRQLVCRL